MQTNDEGDQDSLFGSPPPSPIKDRPLSPCLALPGSSGNSGNGTASSWCSTQNVGTIALPGSHLYSELPVHPLALSLSYTPCESALRPPAQSTPPPKSLLREASRENVPGPSQPRFYPHSGPPLKKKKTSSTAKSKSSTPRPPPPPIELPDPSEPPPANFLRNQSALLGTAGLVGGVKPAHLSVQRLTRGTTPSNPIVVEDELDQPSLSYSFKSHLPRLPPVDPSLLPAPTNAEIVATLIKQKNIFPVLESILKLLAAGITPNPPSRDSSGFGASHTDGQADEGPPSKKRKLARVPAGAGDWDVPYPFSTGEGPQAYRTTWERERGKQLIAQLVGLIKAAAKKAATKAYWEQHDAQMKLFIESQQPFWGLPKLLPKLSPPEEDNIYGHYRPITTTYGLSKHSAQKQDHAQAQMNVKTSTQEIPVNLSSTGQMTCYDQYPQASQDQVSQFTTPLDQLISSLLAATPNERNLMTVNETFTSTGVSGTSTPSEGNMASIDQGLYDDWMSILNAFPMPQNGFGQLSEQETYIEAASTSSTFDQFDHGSPVSLVQFDTVSPIPPSNLFLSIPPHENLTDNKYETDGSLTCDNPTAQASSATDFSQLISPEPSTSDHLIDPALLAISTMGPGYIDGRSRTPSLVPSLPSASSSTEALTPKSASWELGSDITYRGNGDTETDIHIGRKDGSQGVLRCAPRNQFMTTQLATASRSAEDPLSAANMLLQLSTSVASMGKGKQKATEPGPHVASAGPIPMAALEHAIQTAAAGARSTTGGGRAAVVKPLPRDDILMRAKEHRRRLVAEIERAKVELWEATIEQGVLAQLAKDLH